MISEKFKILHPILELKNWTDALCYWAQWWKFRYIGRVIEIDADEILGETTIIKENVVIRIVRKKKTVKRVENPTSER
jgi:hypothetical protein